MSFSAPQIILFSIAYLSCLFGIAYLADRGSIPERIVKHPAMYVLSLGVFAGAMATNGVISLAAQYGYNFLLYYFGAVFMFVLASLLLMPLLRLCRVYQLASLADLLTFRFRSPSVGVAVTIAMCVTLLPLIALQIQAVSHAIQILAGSGAQSSTSNMPNQLAMLFCAIIIIFSILFGTRHSTSRRRNWGLITAIAFESVVKLIALLIVMSAAIYSVFGGFDGLEQWLMQHPQLSHSLNHPIRDNSSRALLLVFFAGAVCMPHIFHMMFTENNDSRDLAKATWGLPLYLLLLSLPILPIAWAGMTLDHSLPIDYSAIAIGLELRSPLISTAAFMASLSAASATIIVTTLALANMCLNHLVLPIRPLQTDSSQGIYPQLTWMRRALISVLILAGYSFYAVLDGSHSLSQLALVAFSGTLQFLPGVLATPYWPRGNRNGLLAGLTAGLFIWTFTMLLPLLGVAEPLAVTNALNSLLGAGDDPWSSATLFSLGANMGFFLLISVTTKTSNEETVAAEICSMDDMARPTRQMLPINSAADIPKRLTPALGEQTAEAEFSRALGELRFTQEESRPYALRRLRARLEANLSGLLGPAVAIRIINNALPFQPGAHTQNADTFLMERNLDRAKPQITGIAADIDDLRRQHRETLDKLPIGICTVSFDSEVLMWNRSMETLTGIAPEQVLGSLVGALDAPWSHLLGDFLQGDAGVSITTQIGETHENAKWLSLHKTSVDEAGTDDTIILVEDVTDLEKMEDEVLHTERLASIGRLAAGVAHEIGNPVTGIACLAQNLEYETDPEEIRHMGQDILKQTSRVTRIVESLMNFSHTGDNGGETELAPANLADCIDEAVHLLTLDREAKPVSFTNNSDRELLVLADSQKLLQVFVNLLGNARDACEEYGSVTISAAADLTEVIIEVEDTGCGIPPAVQSQVFEPFFTTKDPGAGTGLGLALVFSIMAEMNGKVHLTSPIHETGNPGTRITLQLPRAQYNLDIAG
ncbi:MAG: ATP-binding protein [Halioglobus sp.]